MKYLLIVRHAESPLNFNNYKDFDRPLNNKGNKDAKMMADQLLKNNVLPDFIISSGANRALATSQIIAEHIDYQKTKIQINNNIYNSSCDDIMSTIRNVSDEYDKLMIAGHNPTLHLLSQTLSSENIIKFPTCSMFCIKFNIEFWSLLVRGEKLFMIYPQLFR